MKLPKDPLKKAPKIPYRILTSEERKEFCDFARTLGDIDIENRFWQKTIPLAEERQMQIWKGGFVLTKPIDYGCPADGYGSHVHIYPMYTETSKFIDGIDRTKIIGTLELWQSGGFISEPLSVRYSPEYCNLKQIDEAIKLRDYLIYKKIPFSENTSIAQLRDDAIEYENKAYTIRHLMSKLTKKD